MIFAMGQTYDLVEQDALDIYLASSPNPNSRIPGFPLLHYSAFIGGPGLMQQKHQGVMCMCRKYGKPTWFATVTANPNWKEIVANLHLGDTCHDSPELVCRVFYCKVIGQQKANDWMIKLHKRGLPHGPIATDNCNQRGDAHR